MNEKELENINKAFAVIRKMMVLHGDAIENLIKQIEDHDARFKVHETAIKLNAKAIALLDEDLDD